MSISRSIIRMAAFTVAASMLAVVMGVVFVDQGSLSAEISLWSLKA